MTNYELISEIEELPYFNKLLTSGIIPMNWIDYKLIYDFYMEEVIKLGAQKYKIKGIERQAKDNTAREFNVSERQIYLVIKKMRD